MANPLRFLKSLSTVKKIVSFIIAFAESLIQKDPPQKAPLRSTPSPVSDETFNRVFLLVALAFLFVLFVCIASLCIGCSLNLFIPSLK